MDRSRAHLSRVKTHLPSGVSESIRPMIETYPLEQASDAYARMMEGKAASTVSHRRGSSPEISYEMKRSLPSELIT